MFLPVALSLYIPLNSLRAQQHSPYNVFSMHSP